jgi:hypothetical protein
MNMEDYPTLHLETKSSKGTALLLHIAWYKSLAHIFAGSSIEKIISKLFEKISYLWEWLKFSSASSKYINQYSGKKLTLSVP